MSIAYLDPGNIESDLQAGAIAKYKVIRLDGKQMNWQVLKSIHLHGLLYKNAYQHASNICLIIELFKQ